MTDWIGAAEAAERLGIKQASLYAYVSRGCSAGAGRLTAGPACSTPRRSRSWPARAGHGAPGARPSWSSSRPLPRSPRRPSGTGEWTRPTLPCAAVSRMSRCCCGPDAAGRAETGAGSLAAGAQQASAPGARPPDLGWQATPEALAAGRAAQAALAGRDPAAGAAAGDRAGPGGDGPVPAASGPAGRGGGGPGADRRHDRRAACGGRQGTDGRRYGRLGGLRQAPGGAAPGGAAPGGAVPGGAVPGGAASGTGRGGAAGAALCTGPVPDGLIRVLNAALVLLADHELAASTLAARVAASMRADPYAVVATGLGAMGGALHGGAALGAELMLGSAASPEDAPRVVGDLLRRGERLPGFGHFVYKSGDPRANLLLQLDHRIRAGLAAARHRLGGDRRGQAPRPARAQYRVRPGRAGARGRA